MKKYSLTIMVFMMLLVACSNESTVETTSTKDPKQMESLKPNIVEVQDFTSDCSKVVIPSNVERDTNLDKEKGLLTVYWYDDSKGKDMGVAFRYKDQNCSENAKQVIQHVLETKEKQKLPTKEKEIVNNPKYSYSLEIPNDWEGKYTYNIKEANMWFRYVSKDEQFSPTIFFIYTISNDKTDEFESNPEIEFIKLGQRDGVTFYSVYPLDFELESQSEIEEYNQMHDEVKNIIRTFKFIAISNSTSCKTAPKTLNWNDKEYILITENTSQEPVMKYGFLKCSNGKFIGAEEEDNNSYTVRGAGNPTSNKNLIIIGKWGRALYSPVKTSDTIQKEQQFDELKDEKYGILNPTRTKEELRKLIDSIAVNQKYHVEISAELNNFTSTRKIEYDGKTINYYFQGKQELTCKTITEKTYDNSTIFHLDGCDNTEGLLQINFSQ
jgi:uncharacterized protein YcfL